MWDFPSQWDDPTKKIQTHVIFCKMSDFFGISRKSYGISWDSGIPLEKNPNVKNPGILGSIKVLSQIYLFKESRLIARGLLEIDEMIDSLRHRKFSCLSTNDCCGKVFDQKSS